MDVFTLSNGVRIPVIGFGVYQVTKEECKRCVIDALDCGYRLIDTAQSYFNEDEVGQAIEDSSIPREDVFLTSKVWLEHYGHDACRSSVEQSLRKLRTDYLDLMLLHQPFGDAYGAWRALEEMYDEGKIRAIGISNFYADRMVEFALFNRIAPMVNQMETHPLNQQLELKKWADRYNIQMEAWAPFGEGRGNLFENTTLAEIGMQHKKTAAQVMLRWNIQRGVTVLPKSVHKERMKQNIDIFDFQLTEDNMASIAALDTQTSSFFNHRDPKMVEWFAQMVDERRKHANSGGEKKS